MVVASVMRLGCWMPPLAMWWRWWSQWIPCGPPGPGALVDNRKMRKSLARTWSFSHPFLFPMFLYFLWMFAIVFHHFLDPFLKHSFFCFFAIVFHFFSSWCLNHFWSISVGFLITFDPFSSRMPVAQRTDVVKCTLLGSILSNLLPLGNVKMMKNHIDVMLCELQWVKLC